jgi:sugar lactone lactonase YvrE
VDQSGSGFVEHSAQPRTTRAWTGGLGWLVLAMSLACRDLDDYARYERAVDRRAPAVEGVSVGIAEANARFVTTIAGLRNPESVRYDSTEDVFFISNMSGYGSVKDGDGYIVRVTAGDPKQTAIFIQGGANGVTLDAPKGMAIAGDTLWVADIDKLRGFDRTSGAPIATIDFAPQGAILLNDVAAGPGELRVTDTGIRMDDKGNYVVGPSRVFAVGANAAIRVVATDAVVKQPNGIAWDAANHRWIVVSFDQFSWNVVALSASDGAHTLLSREKQGRLDGVEVLPSGGILYASWADSSIHLLQGGHDRQVIREVTFPADIGFDTRRRRVAIPMPTLGWVQLWALGDSGRVATAK